ncbi:MAG: methyltransferase domain-containing protein [Burkholderiaceae bacterium]
MTDALKRGVVGFYDTHPINEDEILTKLAAAGIDVGTMSEDDLQAFDQDHYGGIEVVRELAKAASITAGDKVLDVCSGMGGPARWLAHNIGCSVTGLDFTRTRVDSAERLTQRVGLSDRVSFVHGDATQMPLPAASFDVVMSQESWLHVPGKPAVIGQCAQVVKPGGRIAFTDVVTRRELPAAVSERLAAGMHAHDLGSAQRYVELLEANGCEILSQEDLSAFWRDVLVERLAMYRSLRDTTVAKFGEARYEEYDAVYAHFVGLFVDGVLGGVRLVARRG